MDETAFQPKPEARSVSFTAEQLAAIERRQGDLLLDAGAGSGKTTVLVERFVRAVLEDGADPGSILTITFTEKAAAELRDRIRRRLRELEADAAARATEGAWISTIHGFCARILRASPLEAGIDPRFAVLDRAASQNLAAEALDQALARLAESTAGRELLAAYGAAPLAASVRALYGLLRSAGQRDPRLPGLAPPPDPAAARSTLIAAGRTLARELGDLDTPGVRATEALERLTACDSLGVLPTLEELERVKLPGGGGTALTGAAGVAYREALAALRAICLHVQAMPVLELLDELLVAFSASYEAQKRSVSGLDFEDLELLARDLLRGSEALRERLQRRFGSVMVDEFQDTNRVQLDLIELVASGNLFTVGDAQQSIYGFRHADVELFLERGRTLAERGARATLRTNFRSRPEILEAIGRAFAGELGEVFLPLVPGRAPEPVEDARVEILVVDKGAAWDEEALAAPWRVGEARVLAARIAELLDRGTRAGEIVVLTRATTDLRVYERALEDLGVATYMIGGRGYWGHPQVADLVAYLRALANPLDEEALLGVLASPLVGCSLDALVILADAGELLPAAGAAIASPEAGSAAMADLSEEDRARLSHFRGWFAGERRAAERTPVEELIERALIASGYDLRMLAMAGGRRRLANVRKLMRLAREHEAAAGPDLRAFLSLVRGREGGWIPDPQESEAPVEGEALDAVRLMTVHRSKGLEFPVTCVADLGRSPRSYPELVRVGRGDGRIGLAMMSLHRAGREHALDYQELGAEAAAREAAEERRLFYVACTRAQERLILSGAAKLESWPDRGVPIAWLAPAFLGDSFAACLEAREGVHEGVRFSFVSPPPPVPHDAARDLLVHPERKDRTRSGEGETETGDLMAPATSHDARTPPAPASRGTPVRRLSYSSLGEYRRCAYRFYVERVLGLPPGELEVPRSPSGGDPHDTTRRPVAARRHTTSAGLTATEQGVILHALLERLDFRRPRVPGGDEIARLASPHVPGRMEIDRIATLIERFSASDVCRRLAAVRDVRREERFAFELRPGGLLLTGTIDVLARERPGQLLVVDYKSDAVTSATPAALVSDRYLIQQKLYALACLRAGAGSVEVAHVFLEQPDEPIFAGYAAADAAELAAELVELTRGAMAGEFPVTPSPRRAVCQGCPAEDGLCAWPVEMTRREELDRLF